MENNIKQTALDELIKQINDEINLLDYLHGSEIFGRKVGLSFAKRVALSLKEMEKEQMIEMAKEFTNIYGIEDRDIETFYNETYGGNK